MQEKRHCPPWKLFLTPFRPPCPVSNSSCPHLVGVAVDLQIFWAASARRCPITVALHCQWQQLLRRQQLDRQIAQKRSLLLLIDVRAENSTMLLFSTLGRLGLAAGPLLVPFANTRRCSTTSTHRHRENTELFHQ